MMSTCENNPGQLLSLMNEAFETCVRLQNYSDENYEVFQSDDDEKIFEVISNREKIIESLVVTEYKIDALLDDSEKYEYGASLLTEVDKIRLSIRTVLDNITVNDMEIMKVISGRMHVYKIETLKARNIKNLSAYMGTSEANERGDSIDISN